VHAAIPHWLSSRIYIPTCIHNLFWPRLIAGAWIVGTINWVNYTWSEHFSRWFSFAWSDSVIWRRNVKSQTTLQHLQVQPGPSCGCCKVVCGGRMRRGRLENRSRIYEAGSWNNTLAHLQHPPFGASHWFRVCDKRLQQQMPIDRLPANGSSPTDKRNARGVSSGCE
jgi:hypothetical protein